MTDGITEFWSWWTTARSKVEAALEARDVGALDAEITQRVQAVDPDLNWELGPGADGKHAFALVWNGDLRRRRITEQWVAAAPDSDDRWVYYPARPPGAGWEGMTMELGKHAIEFGKFVCAFTIDEDSEKVDIEIFHPALVKAPENVRSTAAFVMLDRAFGEDGVERWIGVVDIVTAKPKGAQPIGELVAAVAELDENATGERCAVYEGERDGAPMFIMKNDALKPIDHLECDAELAVAMRYDPEESGLPTEEELAELDATEDALVEELSGEAAYHGRETGAATRTLYFFAPEGGAAANIVEAWKKKQKRPVDVTWTTDPTWDGLARWDG